MSEPTTTTEPTKQPQEGPQPQGEPADKPLGPNGEKALKAERDARAAAEKAAADLQKRLDDIEQANLSELEKAQRAAKDAQDQLAAITQQNTRNAVALTKGVPARLVGFLAGSTQAEIEANADLLLAELSAPTTPRPDPTQGAKGEPVALNSNSLEQALKSKLGIS